MEFILDPVMMTLDIKSIKENLSANYSRTSDIYIDIYVKVLIEMEKTNVSCLSVDVLSRTYTSSVIHQAITFWRRAGAFSKVGPSPYKIRYNNIKEISSGKYEYNKSAKTILEIISPSEITDYELARILSWKTIYGFKLSLLSLLTETCFINQPLSVYEIESFILPHISQSMGNKELRLCLSQHRDDLIELKEIKVRLALPAEITQMDMSFYTKWRYEWGISYRSILKACKKTVNANEISLSYLNGILRNEMSDKGIPEDILREFKEVARALRAELTQENKQMFLFLRDKYTSDQMLVVSRYLIIRYNTQVSFSVLSKSLSDWDVSKSWSLEELNEYAQVQLDGYSLLNVLNSVWGSHIAFNKRYAKLITGWFLKLHLHEPEILEIAHSVYSKKNQLTSLDKKLKEYVKDTEMADIPL